MAIMLCATTNEFIITIEKRISLFVMMLCFVQLVSLWWNVCSW